MPEAFLPIDYDPPPPALMQELVSGFVGYYEQAQQLGFRDAADRMGYAGKGTVRVAAERIHNLIFGPTTKAADDFGRDYIGYFRNTVERTWGQYFDGLTLQQLLKKGMEAVADFIPFHIGTVISNGANFFFFPEKMKEEQLHKPEKAGAVLGGLGAADVLQFHNTPDHAKEAADTAFDNYMALMQYMQRMGAGKASPNWRDVVLYSQEVFEVQTLVSSLNVQLIELEVYLACMRTVLLAVREQLDQYRRTLEPTLKRQIDNVLRDQYAAGLAMGMRNFSHLLSTMQSGKAIEGKMGQTPELVRPPGDPSAGMLLAACIADALAQGVHAGMMRGFYANFNRNYTAPLPANANSARSFRS